MTIEHAGDRGERRREKQTAEDSGGKREGEDKNGCGSRRGEERAREQWSYG